MSDFGDLEADDVVDTDPPDPEALARLFYAVRHELAPDDRDPQDPGFRHARFDDEHELVRILMIFVFARIIDKLVREWQKAPL